ncbi:MAG: glycosyltransferase [Eubacteriales bacterium]
MLIVSKAYLPEIGGIETAIHQMAKTQIANGDPCRALVYSKSNKEKQYEYEGVPVYCMPSIFSKKSIRFSFQLRKRLKEMTREKEIVMFSYPTFQADCVNKKYNNSYKLVCYHADITRWGRVGKAYQNIIGSRFLKNAEKIIVSNPKMIQSSKILKKNEGKCVVLPYGVDIQQFAIKQSEIKEKIYDDLGVQNKRLLLFVGRIARYKGVGVLMDALAELSDEYRLVIVSNGDVDEKYGDQIARLNIENKFIQYMGVARDELADFYNACDLLVMPSTDRAEAFGIVAIEAMACGLPVISTELGTGTSYHNIDGITGRVISPNDVQELTDAIAEVCSDKHKYSKENARKRAEDFSMEKFSSQWTKIIEEIKTEIKNV